nr:DNA-directed RNA polymerase subunit [Cedratvirus plubellavi]
MQELPDEVALMVLEKLPVGDLPAFCASNKQYRRLCSDRHIWLDIFSRKGLPLLEEGVSFTSWIVVYRNSLLAKRKSDYIISFYEKTRTAWLFICNPIPLYQIRHAELLGEENLELSTLIDEDIYGQQIRDTQSMEKKMQMFNLPEENFVQPKRIVGLFLSLSKRGEEFVLQVENQPSVNKAVFEQKISKERTRDILYRLCYYNLFQPHQTFFTEYAEENRKRSTARFPPLVIGNNTYEF